MNIVLSNLFLYYTIGIVLVAIAGIYCILLTYNLVRALIGVELLMKVATLSIILAGFLTGNVGLAQAIVITLIVIEVVLMVSAGGIILWVFRCYDTIDPRKMDKLKG